MEAALAFADAHSLSLTVARISSAIDALASEISENGRASSPSPACKCPDCSFGQRTYPDICREM